MQEVFDILAGQARTYEQDGALFLNTAASGDDKDRRFDRVIDVLGADHLG